MNIEEKLEKAHKLKLEADLLEREVRKEQSKCSHKFERGGYDSKYITLKCSKCRYRIETEHWLLGDDPREWDEKEMKIRFQEILDCYNKKLIIFNKYFMPQNMTDEGCYKILTVHVGDKVSHSNYGPGKVIKIMTHEICKVDFEGNEYAGYGAAKRDIRAEYLNF